MSKNKQLLPVNVVHKISDFCYRIVDKCWMKMPNFVRKYLAFRLGLHRKFQRCNWHQVRSWRYVKILCDNLIKYKYDVHSHDVRPVKHDALEEERIFLWETRHFRDVSDVTDDWSGLLKLRRAFMAAYRSCHGVRPTKTTQCQILEGTSLLRDWVFTSFQQ